MAQIDQAAVETYLASIATASSRKLVRHILALELVAQRSRQAPAQYPLSPDTFVETLRRLRERLREEP